MNIEFSHLMPSVAGILLGEPNKKRSNKHELRYGNKGSLSVDLTKGTFFDHESNEGGGVLDLIKRQGHANPIEWLRQQRLIEDKTLVATFDYRDESGKLLFQVCRTTNKRKAFFQRQPDGHGGWRNDIQGVRRVLYRLPELLKETGVVFICEGEKHVDALRAWGLRATCNPMGAGMWKPEYEYTEYLRGQDIVLLPDNDDTGRKHVQAIAQSASGVASRIRVLPLPDLAVKGDIINWKEAGGTKEKLLELAEATPDWKPTPPLKVTLGDVLKNAADLQTKTFDELKWIVPVYLPEGTTLLGGRPKIGKSWWLLSTGIAVATGGEFLGQQCEQGDVLALFLEDSDRRLQRRMTTLLGAYKGQWPERLQYATRWPLLSSGGLDWMREWIGKVRKPRLIIVDILERVRSHNKDEQTTQYTADYHALIALQKLSTEAQLSIVVSLHQRKQGADDLIDTISGTLGLGGAADTVLVLANDALGKFLYGRGRDLEEFSINMKQDERYRWQNLGPKTASAATPERAAIIAVLAKAGRPMTTAEIAIAVGGTRDNIKNLLSKMHFAHEIERVTYGVYQLSSI
jgi:hypothetical protein